MSLDRLKVARRSGNEPFHSNGAPLGFTVAQFWEWSASDLVSNSMRGVVAEFLVAQAIGSADGIRVEWDAVDLRTLRGTTIEVKASGYVQTWKQVSIASPKFSIKPSLGWDAGSNSSAQSPTRSAQLYVFALHHHEDKATIDAMDVSQWSFFVVPTAELDRKFGKQASVGLSRVRSLVAAVPFSGLGEAILAAERVLSETRDTP